MRPLRRVRMVTMWSASPRSWVRSTMPSSRYCPTPPLSRTPATVTPGRATPAPLLVGVALAAIAPDALDLPAPGAVDRRQHGPQGRGHRVGVDADAPQGPAADLALDVRRRLGVAARGQRVLGVVEDPHLDPEGAQRVAERG